MLDHTGMVLRLQNCKQPKAQQQELKHKHTETHHENGITLARSMSSAIEYMLRVKKAGFEENGTGRCL